MKLYILLFSYLLIIALSNEVGEFGVFDYKSLIFPLSHNPWWFMRIYFLLALSAALLLEPLLKTLNKKEWIKLTMAFIVVDVYLGYLCKMETVHYGGYNLIHFITIYLIGGLLRNVKIEKYTSVFIKEIHAIHFLVLFILVALLKMLVHILLSQGDITDRFMDYNNPFNIVLSVCVFFGIMNINIKNTKIQFVSSSVVGVYLISEHPLIKKQLMILFDKIIGVLACNFILEVLFTLLFIMGLFMVAIYIDKLRLLFIDYINKSFAWGLRQIK